MTASQLGPGGIILCAVSLTAAACIICVAAVGNPFVLYQFCIPKASLPPPSRSSRSRDATSSSSPAQDDGNDAAAADNGDEEEQQRQMSQSDNSPSEDRNQDQGAPAAATLGDSDENLTRGRRISGPSSAPASPQTSILPSCLHPTNWSFFGYVFDIDSYRESVRIRREQQQTIMLDEQIRRLDQLVATERELRQRIADGDTDRATRLQLSRVQRFRYGLAMRTREERRRRRMEFMREVLEADEEAAAQEEQSNHFKHTLTAEEKQQILDQVLDYHQYHRATKNASGTKEEGAKGYTAGVKAALSASIRSRMSDRTMGANEENAEAKGESTRLCSICLDEYGE